MRLMGHTCRIEDVTSDERAQMFSLMRANYQNIDRETFEEDFRQKDWVIVARDPTDGRVYGFSTQTFYQQPIRGKTTGVLFSGDTIVDRRYWSSNPISQLWGRLALSLIDSFPQHPMYWFLISKGYKTYRFLPVFFREFYPRYDMPTPDDTQQLISEVASARFGSRYDRQRGVVLASDQDCRLRPQVAEITPDRLKNPHIAFFDQANPGHARGDELCCVAPLSRANFNRKAMRVIGAGPPDLAVEHLESPSIISGQ